MYEVQVLNKQTGTFVTVACRGFVENALDVAYQEKAKGDSTRVRVYDVANCFFLNIQSV